MAGFLDFLNAPGSDQGIGGLLDYLNSPLYQTPQSQLSNLGSGNPEAGLLPTLQPASPFDAGGGQTYSPAPNQSFGPPGSAPAQAPAPSAFDVGAPQNPAFSGVYGVPLSAPSQVDPASAISQQMETAPMSAPWPYGPVGKPAGVGAMPTPSVAPATAPAPVVRSAAPVARSAAPVAPGDDDEEPVNNTPTARQRAQAMPPGVGPSFMQSAGNNADAGFQSFLGTQGGLGDRILAGIYGGVTGKRTDEAGIKQSQLQDQAKAIYSVLVQNGESPDVAQRKATLAALNPEAAKLILGDVLGQEKYSAQTVTDALGGTHIEAFNPRTGKLQSAGPDNSGAPSETSPLPGGKIFADGVKAYDPTLKGDAYLNQFSPEVQNAAKAYINGDVMPSGGTRGSKLAQMGKTVAQTWGQSVGQEVSDNTYAAKHKMTVELASSSNSSMGGILSNGKSAFDHLKTYSDKLADVGNYNLNGVPAGAVDALNSATNAMSGTKQAGKISAANEAGLKYGQESTKFYSGSGGGEAERMAALHANNAKDTSGNEQAGFVQAERDLMVGRLAEKEAQLRDTMGQAYLDKHPVMTPELKSTIAGIDANIARLRGDAPSAQPTGNVSKAGVSWSIVK